MALIWATVQDVRDYLGDDLPAAPEVSDAVVQRHIDKITRALEATIIRWPEIDDTTERAADEAVRGHMVAAVAETVARRREDEQLDAALGGMSPILEAGGSVSTGKLTVSTVGRAGGSRGAAVGDRAVRLPIDAVEALSAAGLIGGGVASW